MATVGEFIRVGEDNGWLVKPTEARGYIKDHRFVEQPYVADVEFFKGEHAVRVEFTRAGSVARVLTRSGFLGRAKVYAWVPGGIRQRKEVGLEILKDGASECPDWSYLP